MPNPVAAVISLDAEERAELERRARRPKSAQALALRARIVLAADQGLKNTEIAERLGIAHSSVRKWRNRFAEHGLDGLTDEPRPGRPRTVTDEMVEEVIVKTLETTPKDATHWSTRSMAAEVGLSQSAVSRIWRAFGLQPHRQEIWKLSKDPLFIDKVRDVVDCTSIRPSAPWCCAWMRSPRSRPGRHRSCRCSPGPLSAPRTTTSAPARQACMRRWTSRLARTSAPCTRATARSTSRNFCRGSTARCPTTSTSTSCSTTARRIRRRRSKNGLPRTPAFGCHFTPTSASWLNLVERWFAELTQKQLRRGAHRSVHALNTDS